MTAKRRLALLRSLKDLARQVLPPAVARGVKRLRPEWRHAADARAAFRTNGWESAQIAQAHADRWERFARLAAGKAALGFTSEDPDLGSSVTRHNVVLSFGYVLARAAHERRNLSVLDWGGGIGHYHVLAQALMPDVSYNYTVVDLPVALAHGPTLSPQVEFETPGLHSWGRRFDLILASGSLQCVEDWQSLARNLAASASNYFYLTRLPIVTGAATFAAIQRGAPYGFDADFASWCFNRNELIDTIEKAGLVLVREFMLEDYPVIAGAPEQPRCMGFLFRRAEGI